MVLTGIRRMEVIDVPEPQLEHDTDVLVRMGAVGVCGSDVHYYVSGGIGAMRVEYPFTVGHEGAGVVSGIGQAVKSVKEGDRVALDPAISCEQCDQCLAGRPNTCRQLRFISCPGEATGCLCEYVVMPERNCYPIPDSLTLEQAAVAEPLAIGLYAVRQSVPMKGARIAILGAGPIGLSVLICAVAGGAGRVYVTEKVDERAAAARRAAACWTGDPTKQDIVAEITGMEPEQPETVFECCGEQEALDQAITLLKPGGKLMILGIPEEQRISFDVDELRRKEITVNYVRRQRYCVEDALDLIAGRQADIDPLVTHRFPLARVQEAFDLVDGYRDGVVKAMIVVS